jgi:trans-aconitate methyltransferase
MKLNLGCGDDYRPGWLNVDVRPLYPPSAEFWCGDLRDLDGRVADETADEIEARAVLEYLPWREVDAALVLLAKKLRPGGRLRVDVPDGEQLARAFLEGELSHATAQGLIYGAQGHAEDTRKSLWSAAAVQRRFDMIGVRVERLEHQDGRVRAWGTRLSG